MDFIKHGESAYPADAWVETQYMKDGGAGLTGVSFDCFLCLTYVYMYVLRF
jgi:hypothetical protein